MQRPRKRRSVSPRSTAAVCLAVLDKLCFGQAELCAPFLNPVDCILYPEYARLIARPVDLGSVRRRLREDPAYAGDAFAEDVRTCFGNAMLFNQPHDPIFTAAAALLERFEHEWGKFADEPPELPLRTVAAAAVQVQSVSSEAGKIVLKMKKRAPAVGEVSELQERAGVFRERAEALMVFCDLLASGAPLEQATAETIAHWRAAPNAGYPAARLQTEAQSVLSALEDSQPPVEIGAWLAKHLSATDDVERLLLSHVAAALATETEPCVEAVSVVLQSPQLCGCLALWRTMMRAVSESSVARRILALLKKLVAVAAPPAGGSGPFEVLLDELHARAGRAEVTEGMERFAHWLLVERVPPRIDWLARASARFPRLRESVGRLAVNAILRADDSANLADLIQLSYRPEVSAPVVKQLLLARQPDKAARVAKELLQKHPERVAPLLEECLEAAKEDSRAHEPLTVLLVQRAAATLSGETLKGFLRRFVSVPNSSRQQRFANVVASAFLASQAASWEQLLVAVVRLAWLPNPLLPAVMEPHVAQLLQQLRQHGKREAVVEAMFALECASAEGWESWKALRDELLAGLIGFSAETQQEHDRILLFKKVSLRS